MGALFFQGASELATITNTFTVTSGGITTPTDPTTVTLTVTDPQGNATTYTYGGAQITRTGAGAYAKDISCSLAGEWQYTWTGTGTVPDVNHGSFSVQETNLGHLYATPQMIRSRVGIPSTDSSNDLELHQACYAASRHVEQYCGRFFWRTLASEVRTFTSIGLWDVELGPFNDLVSVGSFKTDQDGDGVFETTWASSDYELNPVNTAAGPEARPYTSVRTLTRSFPYVFFPWNTRLNRVQITGVYGWVAVPAAVTEATRLLAAEVWKLKDAPFGIAAYGEYGAIRVRENPMVAMLLNPYRHGNGYVV